MNYILIIPILFIAMASDKRKLMSNLRKINVPWMRLTCLSILFAYCRISDLSSLLKGDAPSQSLRSRSTLATNNVEGGNLRIQKQIIKVSKPPSAEEQLPTKIITACSEDYIEKAFSLANQLGAFDQTLHIVPLNWIPSDYSLSDTNDIEDNGDIGDIDVNKRVSHPSFKYESPIVNTTADILSLKLAALASHTQNSPTNSTLLWLDADTAVLGDVHKITERSISDGCHISLKIRQGRCIDRLKKHSKDGGRQFKYAAGVISIRVSSATRRFFQEAYEFSTSGVPNSFMLYRRVVDEDGGGSHMIRWYQDQLAFYELLEHTAYRDANQQEDELKVCSLNDDEMYLGHPHLCTSRGSVNSSTITYSGKAASTGRIRKKRRNVEKSY